MPKELNPPRATARRARGLQNSANPTDSRTKQAIPIPVTAVTDTGEPPIRRSHRLGLKAVRTETSTEPSTRHPKAALPAASVKTRRDPPIRQKRPSLKNAPVPGPTVDRLPPVMGSKLERRSEVAQARESAQKSSHNTQRWVDTCPVFVARGITLSGLKARPKNSAVDKRRAEEVMEAMKLQEADAFSMVIVSEDGEVLFAYFAYASPPGSARPQWPTFGEFLKGDVELASLPEYPGSRGRTESDVKPGMKHDGLQEPNLHRTHVAMQNLSHYVPPVANDRDKRHPDDNMIVYPSASTSEGEEPLLDGEVIERDGVEHCQQTYERAGVLHLVHAWRMQGHTNGYLYPSRDMHHTPLGYLAASGYYLATEATAQEIDDRFAASFPDTHAAYAQAFKAGVVNSFDKGPFLGRALVWKMQVNVHQDGLDEGPAAIFPCGYYSGGCLHIPELGLKLAYRPRDLAILLAGNLYHAVDDWSPAPVPEGMGVSPGRVSSVFFFPAKSFRALAGRPEHWNLKTMTGQQYKGKETASNAK